MLIIDGHTKNITARIVGRVVKRPRLFGTGSDILLTKRPAVGLNRILRHVGIVTSACLSGDKLCKPTVFLKSESDYDLLNDGDVVALEPDGRINVLYQVGSPHNAIFATEMCNSRCIMCPQPPLHGVDDKTDENVHIVKLMDRRRTPSLGITGGEPTLLGARLVKIIQACKECLPKTHVALLTNAKLLRNIEYVRDIVKIGHPDLTYCIPIYAGTDREHDAIVGSNGSFNNTFEAIHHLARFRQNIEIRVVLIKQNWKRLMQLCDFIYRNMTFVNHIAIMGMETTGLATSHLDEVWVDPQDYAQVLDDSVRYLDQRGMNVSIYNMQLCVIPKRLWRFSRQSISTWKNIYLDVCDRCLEKNRCGGLFASSADIHSVAITPIVS